MDLLLKNIVTSSFLLVVSYFVANMITWLFRGNAHPFVCICRICIGSHAELGAGKNTLYDFACGLDSHITDRLCCESENRPLYFGKCIYWWRSTEVCSGRDIINKMGTTIALSSGSVFIEFENLPPK